MTAFAPLVFVGFFCWLVVVVLGRYFGGFVGFAGGRGHVWFFPFFPSLVELS